MVEQLKNPYENEIPSIKVIHDTFQKSIKDCLDKNYFPEFGSVKKWQCFTDYCFDSKKPNDIITFTLFPYVMEYDTLVTGIKGLAPVEIKKATKINPVFVEFIRVSPFISFSFILQNHRHLFLQNRDGLKEAMLFSMNKIIDEDIPNWSKSNPELKDYHKRITKRTRAVIHLIKNDKKIRILKNMFLITSIGSYICTQFANKTQAEVFGWFSDRDEINDIASNYSIDLFNIQFSAYLNNRNCKFIAAPASSMDIEWYKEFIKIPDFITGTLADYNFENGQVSHDKFLPIVRNLIADNDRNMFVLRLLFNDDSSMECARVKLHKEKD